MCKDCKCSSKKEEVVKPSERNYKFFQNKKCEFFPCHPGIKEEEFNCLFCFCPLYALGKDCGGEYLYLEDGTKDCSSCLKPHIKGNYDLIVKELRELVEKVKEK